jgi:hypothetical protein
VFDSGLENAFGAVYGRDDDLWHRGEWKTIRRLRVGITIGVIRVDMVRGSGVSNGVNPVQNVIERPWLPRSFESASWRMDTAETNMAYRGDILHDGELELVAIFCEEFLEMISLFGRSDDAPDGVPLFEKDVDDVDGEEPVCAGDEDFSSWSDSRHDLQCVCVQSMWKGAKQAASHPPSFCLLYTHFGL